MADNNWSKDLYSVIMAGGSGTRFWPLSRKSFPKQFLKIGSDRSFIQQAFDRCQPWVPASRTWIVTGHHLAPLVQADLPEIPEAQILKEPAPRNTAACVALAAISLCHANPDAIMLAMPADHVIDDANLFQNDVRNAVQIIKDDPSNLVLFGVPPTFPATGFGYIEKGKASKHSGFQVASFKEKPNRETADLYLKSGQFLWNCGIFVWKAARIYEAIAAHEPELAAGVEQLKPHLGRATWDQALKEIFPTLKSTSIDYAVLERESKITVVEATFPWNDVGGWEAAGRLAPLDEQGNAKIGNCVTVDSQNCIVRSTPDHVVSVLGMTDCIVVHTPDATFVAKRGDDEAIRKLIDALQKQQREQYL